MKAEFENNYGNSFLKLEYERRNRTYPRTKEINISNVLRHITYLGEDIIVYHTKNDLKLPKLKVVRSDTWDEVDVDLDSLGQRIHMRIHGQLDFMEDAADDLVDSAKEKIRRSKVESMARRSEDKSTKAGDSDGE